MKRFSKAVAMAIGALLASGSAAAATGSESLFTSADPYLHRNKQVAYHIFRDLVQCAQWDKADRYLTERYIQHNPLISSGRAEVVGFFANLKLPRRDKCDTLDMPVSAVIAEGDYVTVMLPVRYKVPGKPGEHYTTTWFDTWRIVDGKADEHWDAQKLCPGLSALQCMLSSFEEAN